MRESIHDLLRNFRGLEPLKRLFWQELNYDRVNQPVPTRDWGDAERQMISGEPLLLAEHGEFKVRQFGTCAVGHDGRISAVHQALDSNRNNMPPVCHAFNLIT
jgi:hypothetical protein